MVGINGYDGSRSSGRSSRFGCSGASWLEIVAQEKGATMVDPAAASAGAGVAGNNGDGRRPVRLGFLREENRPSRSVVRRNTRDSGANVKPAQHNQNTLPQLNSEVVILTGLLYTKD
jgi:hypothetical protein